VERVIRPPFGRVRQLSTEPKADPDPNYRDPRVFRDQLSDMRMPPYMRDASLQALSLSWRQYHLLIGVIEYLRSTDPTTGPPHGRAAKPAESSSGGRP